MRALLDINVIIALFDPDHSFHERAHGWWAMHERYGWASCPLTENGAVRIMSNPGYSRTMQFSPGDLIGQMCQFVDSTDHEFWEDSVSLRNKAIFATDRIHSSRHLTDLYLLGLAVSRQGRLVTFDTKIPISAVNNAEERNLCVI
jgi:toxin-antitoxin system PIN domain toxin